MTILWIGKLRSRWHVQHQGQTLFSHPARRVVEGTVLMARKNCLTPTAINILKANGDFSYGYDLDGKGTILKIEKSRYVNCQLSIVNADHTPHPSPPTPSVT